MEYLFSTHIQQRPFRVVFDHENYIFLPDADDAGASQFSFKRGHDEWIGNDALNEEIRTQAVDALDNYLMKQH